MQQSKQQDSVPFTEVKRQTIHGRWFVSGNGQMVIDLHDDDQHHLRSPAMRSTQPLYDCRTYLKELIPQEWQGRRGTTYVDRAVTPDGEVMSITMSFVPTASPQ